MNQVPASQRWLALSGVDISSVSEADRDRTLPRPDYLVLRETLDPTIVDVTTVRTGGRLARFVHRRIGPAWAVTLVGLAQLAQHDAVFATGEDVGLRLALAMKLLRRRTPLVVTCHNITGRRSRLLLGPLRAGTRVTAFHCLSESQANLLERRFGVNRNRIQVIAWHVDHDYFTAESSPAATPLVVSAGMASRDYATLVEASRGLGVTVVIAADSPWFRQALNIDAHDVPANVTVGSAGDYSGLRRLYQSADVVVVPLQDVEFSAGYTVILEGMACGKPVIVTRTRQPDDFVVDGVTGFHVAPGDAEHLRERLVELIDNPMLAREMGERGRKRVEAAYTLNDYGRQLRETAEGIARSGRLDGACEDPRS